MQQPAAARALWPPELQEKAQPAVLLFFSHLSEKPWTAGKDVIPPIILQHTQAIWTGKGSDPAWPSPWMLLQDSESEFRVVFLAAVGAKLEQRDHSHLASHASAAIDLVVIDILSVQSERKLTF